MSSFTDEANAKAILEDVRNDTKETNWVSFGYDEGNAEQVSVKGHGSGYFKDVSEAVAADSILYFVLTVPLKQEGTLVNKYIFITWIGEAVKPAARARSTQHKLPIYKFVNTVLQLGGELQATTNEELTEDIVKGKLLGTRVVNENEEVNAEAAKARGGGSEKFQIENEAAVTTSIEDLRNNKTATNWIHLGYTGEEDPTVRIKGTGEQEPDHLKELIKDEEVCYFLVRLKVPEAGNVQVKYICITWVGPTVKPLHRARSSQHRHLLYNFAKKSLQLAGEIQVLNREDLTEVRLLEKLAGTFSQERTEEQLRAAAELDAKKKSSASPQVPRKGAAEETFKSPLADEESVIPILQDLFKPTTPSNWVAFGYAIGNKNDVSLLAQGNGGIDELEAQFDPKAVVYSILGIVTPNEGDYSLKKYLFVTWVGGEVKPLQRARSSQHRVSLYNFSNKYVNLAGEVSAQTKEECTEKKLLEKLTVSRQEVEEGKKNPASSGRGAAASSKGKEQVKFEIANEEEANTKIKLVREDSSPNDWLVFGYAEGNKDALHVVGSGAGGLEEMRKFFKDSDIVFGLLSVVVEEKEAGEDYKTKKFTFIAWVGPDSKPLVKARSSQVRLALINYLKKSVSISAELQAVGHADISQEIVMQKLAGSRN